MELKSLEELKQFISPLTRRDLKLVAISYILGDLIIIFIFFNRKTKHFIRLLFKNSSKEALKHLDTFKARSQLRSISTIMDMIE